MFLNAGYQVKVYAFSRKYYEANTFPKGCEIIHLGQIPMKRYLSRVPKLGLALCKIKISEMRAQVTPQLIYAFGMDMAFLGSLLRNKNYLVYELADIQNPLPHQGILSKLLGHAERHISNSCDNLVVTSKGFLDRHLSMIDPKISDKTTIIENKVSSEISQKFPRPATVTPPGKPIKIGFVGRIRYKKSILPLLEAVSKRASNYELHFFGDGPLGNLVTGYAQSSSNIFFHGPFVSIDDLQMIYSKIDVSYVVYDNSEINVQLLMPNKFYEAVYFGKPIVAAKNTYLANSVEATGTGFIIDPQENGFVEKFLDSLTVESIRETTRICLKCPTGDLVENQSANLQAIHSSPNPA